MELNCSMDFQIHQNQVIQSPQHVPEQEVESVLLFHCHMLSSCIKEIETENVMTNK